MHRAFAVAVSFALPLVAQEKPATAPPAAPPAAAPVAAARAPSTKLDLDLLLDWESVGDPHCSPDGKQIVFTRTWTDKMEDRLRSELWLMDADGSRQRLLTVGSDAQWSPDGSRIAYLAEGAPKGSQVFVVWVATRETTQLTHGVESPSNLQWSHDGKWLACNQQVPEKEGFTIAMPSAPKGSKWTEEPKVITRLNYRRDQSGYVPSGWRHIFVLPADGGTPRQVTSGDFDHGAPQWTFDDQELVFDGLREVDADWQVGESEIYAVNVESGAVRQLTTRKGPDASPLVLKNDVVVYLGHDHTGDSYDVNRVYAMPLRGEGAPRCLTPELDRSPAGLLREARGESTAFFCQFEEEGGVRAARLDLDGKLAVLSPKEAQFRPTEHLGAGALLGTLTTPTEPGAVAILRDGAFVKLTHVHDDLLHGRRLGAVEELWWDGPDGFRVQGWLVKPPDFDATRKYPLILQIHGGPHAMFGVNFDFERHNHAAEGYLLLYCNPRGSTGYGKKFGNAINNAYPSKDYDDLMAGVDAAIAKGNVDPQNLFVYGGSGGGVLTAWIVGSTDRFKAAVSMFPVIDWISFVGTTDGPYWYTNFKKLPWEDVSEHWQRSPLRLVGNVKTPTMLITGELDLRTPMGQSEEYYQALKLRKVDTALVRVQDEYHGASSRHPSNRLRRILYVRTWFEKHKAK
jgi:dipeptidyl aminopeptidase/acylaminoacyl peptidase